MSIFVYIECLCHWFITSCSGGVPRILL